MTRDIKTETGSRCQRGIRGRELVLIILLALFLVRESGTLLAAQETLQGKQEAKEVETPPPSSFLTFAQLRYVSSTGSSGLVSARDLVKIQIVESAHGEEFWLELFFHNADYVLSKISELTFYQTVPKVQKAKVLMVRVSGKKMGFPQVLGR